jgi:hypothetical protein
MARPEALCSECVAALKGRVSPTHPVDPETLQAPSDKMRGALICPKCLATWRRFDGVTLLDAAHQTNN